MPDAGTDQNPTDTYPKRVVALMNQKGGVGKTTTTVNLAAALARSGSRTLVVDLDPQAHATLHLGADPDPDGNPDGNPDVNDAAPMPSVYDAMLEPSESQGPLHRVSDNLWLLPSETDLAGFESDLAGAPNAQTRLRDVLAGLRVPSSATSANPSSGQPFDAVLLDCPPSLGLLTINGLCAATEVLIPMQAHFLALQGVGKLLETIAALRGGLNQSLTVTGVVLCSHDRQATHTQEVVRDLVEFFEAAQHDPTSPWSHARVLDPPIRRNIKLAECPSFGQTIFDYAPDAAGAADYAALAESLLHVWGIRNAESATDTPHEPEIHTIPQAAAHVYSHNTHNHNTHGSNTHGSETAAFRDE